MKKSELESLDLLPCLDSGLDFLLQEEEAEKKYSVYLGKFLLGKNQELQNLFLEHPELICNLKIKALFLLNTIILDQKIHSYYVSIAKPDPKIIDNLSYELIVLYSSLRRNFIIRNIDFYRYLDLLPNLIIYFSDLCLQEPSWGLDLGLVYDQIISEDKFQSLVDDNLIAQRYRLLALYFRRMKDDLQSEHYILQYRKTFRPNLSSPIVLEKLKPLKSISRQNFVSSFDDLYQEVKSIQEEVLIRSGVHRDTCEYFKCSDCCKKDYPTVSLVEFLYILNHLQQNQIQLSPLIQKAKSIQANHESLFGYRMQIVDQVSSEENPNAFQFTCPLLDDKEQCSIHSARPLACRAFGLSTINDQDVQACKFYLTQYQYNSSHRNERVVYDSRPHTAMIGSANQEAAKQYGFEFRQPVGTLPAWLTCDKLKLNHLE